MKLFRDIGKRAGIIRPDKGCTTSKTPLAITGRLGKPSFIFKIKCYRCGKVSYNQNDVKYKYCANCKIFHE